MLLKLMLVVLTLPGLFFSVNAESSRSISSARISSKRGGVKTPPHYVSYDQALQLVHANNALTVKEKEFLSSLLANTFYGQIMSEMQLRNKQRQEQEVQRLNDEARANSIYKTRLVAFHRGSPAIFNDFLTMRY